MTDLGDPKRWWEADSDAPDAVRRVLEACRKDVGTDAELALLEAKLGPIAAPAPPAGEGVSAGLGKTYLVKAAAGLVVAAGAAALYLTLGADEAPAGATLASPPSSVPAAVVVPVEAQLASPAQAAALPSTADEGPGAAPSEGIPARSPAPRTVAPAVPSEAELLGAAQSALGSSPARALSLLDEHRRRYARGMMVQEREVMVIEALGRLGRKADAGARAERFLKSFPGSAHRARVQGFIQGR